jgi:23S rRNA pseudouridine1911/1915/1917 synthase
MGHPVAGDKLYGPDERLMLEFIAHGFSPKLAAALPLERQALHCGELVFADEAFRAPLAEDMAEFCRRCSLAVPPA